MIKRYIWSLLILFVLFVVSPNHAFANSATLEALPSTGNVKVGDNFTVQVKIDGGGVSFNAAKAIVTISPTLQVQSVTLGDCGLAFVKTPTQTDPSFTGVILGDSSTNCTVYTLGLFAQGPGTGAVTFINESIKAFKGAQEILQSTKNAAFTISGSMQQTSLTLTPTTAPKNTTAGHVYTLLANLDIPDNVPQSTVVVTLDPSLPTQRSINGSSPTFTNPLVLDNVTEGVHVLEVSSKGKIISKQILTAGGTNGTLVFGISQTKKSVAWVMYTLFGAGALIIITIAYFLYQKVKANSF